MHSCMHFVVVSSCFQTAFMLLHAIFLYFLQCTLDFFFLVTSSLFPIMHSIFSVFFSTLVFKTLLKYILKHVLIVF